MVQTIQSLPQGIQLYLDNASSMAHDIIKPSERFYEGSAYKPYYHTPSYYYHYNSEPTFWSLLFPQRHIVHHVHHTSNQKSRKKEKGQALVLLGTALTVASGVMLYNFASEYSKRSNAIEDLKRFERDRQIVNIDLQSASLSPKESYELEHITQLQKEILNTYKTDSELKLVLKGSIVAGLLAGLGACIQSYFETSYKSLAVASFLLTLSGGFGLAIKSGLDSTDLTLNRKANEVLSRIQSFQYHLKHKV